MSWQKKTFIYKDPCTNKDVELTYNISTNFLIYENLGGNPSVAEILKALTNLKGRLNKEFNPHEIFIDFDGEEYALKTESVLNEEEFKKKEQECKKVAILQYTNKFSYKVEELLRTVTKEELIRYLERL